MENLGMGKPDKKTVIKAIENSGGVISTIAKKLNCAWSTAESYIKDSPETLQAYKDEEEKILDAADVGLYKAIQNNESWAIKWIQSTKGKKRGYTERLEMTGENGSPIKHESVVIEVLSPYQKVNEV